MEKKLIVKIIVFTLSFLPKHGMTCNHHNMGNYSITINKVTEVFAT